MNPPRSSPVDWSRLSHARGSAEDTPGRLAALRGGAWADAVSALHDSLIDQGSVSPATVAAVPFLADIALDPAAPGRLGALWLLRAVTRVLTDDPLPAGAHLPAGTDPIELDRRARAAVAEAARRLPPLMTDRDPHVRVAVYGIAGALVDSPVARELVPHLRRRFNREDDQTAAIALMEPLLRHGAFLDADLATLAASGDDTILFAAAWSSVAVGRELPGAVDHLVRLWPAHAAHYPVDQVAGTSLTLLAERAGARAAELLRRLEEARAADVDELIDAWLALRAASVALTGLLSLPAGTPTVAARLVDALTHVLPGAPERSPEVCDAIVRLAEAATDTALLTSAAVGLFAARDRRWFGFAAAIVATHPTEPLVGPAGWQRLSPALLGSAGRWAPPELVAFAAEAVATWPATAPEWVGAVAGSPPTAEVVRVLLAALPHAPAQAGAALTRIGFEHPELTAAGGSPPRKRRGDPGDWARPAPDGAAPADPPGWLADGTSGAKVGNQPKAG